MRVASVLLEVKEKEEALKYVLCKLRLHYNTDFRINIYIYIYKTKNKNKNKNKEQTKQTNKKHKQ